MSSLRKSDLFVDVCTQRDYLYADGAYPSSNAHNLLEQIKHVMAYVRWAKAPTISCVDVRRFDDVRGLSTKSCVVGTRGQRKAPFTVLPDRVVVDSDNCLCVALDLLDRHQQLILAKDHVDPLANPKLDRLLTELPARRFVVFGIGLEASLRLLVLGLLLRGRRVALIRDACGFWNAGEAEMALRQLEAKGCELISTTDLLSSARALMVDRPAAANGHAPPNGNGAAHAASVNSSNHSAAASSPPAVSGSALAPASGNGVTPRLRDRKNVA